MIDDDDDDDDVKRHWKSALTINDAAVLCYKIYD